MSTDEYKTPEYYHCIEDPRLRDAVYEPEADTFLFLDALDLERARLTTLAPRTCVEVGCGSGTVITHLFAVLQGKGGVASDEEGGPERERESPRAARLFYAIDVNPLALEAAGMTWGATLRKFFPSILPIGEAVHDGGECVAATGCGQPSPTAPLSTYVAHGGGESPQGSAAASPLALRLVEGDLLSGLDDAGPSGGVVGDVDVVLFNPPYVPTSMEELQDAIDKKDIITAAWCGGPRGRVVLDRFLEMLPRYLSRRGLCYVVLIRENDAEDVADFVERAFRAHVGSTWGPSKVTEMVCVAQRYTGEHLSIHRISYADA